MPKSSTGNKGTEDGDTKRDASVTLIILKTIKESHRLPKNGINPRRLKRYVKILVKDDKIRMIGYGTWEVTSLGETYILQLQHGDTWRGGPNLGSPLGGGGGLRPKSGQNNTLISCGNGLSKLKRGHGWQWRIRVLAQDWAVLAMDAGLNYSIRRTGIKTEGIRIVFKGFLWDFFPSAVNIYPEASLGVLGRSALECDKVMRSRLLEAVKGLESLGFKLHLLGSLNLSVVKGGEFAEVGNELARKLKRDGDGLRVKGEDGKVWLLFDQSKGLSELETVHPERAQVDMDDKLAPFFEFIRVNPGCLHDLTALLAASNAQLFTLAKSVDLLAKVLRSHLDGDGGV